MRMGAIILQHTYYPEIVSYYVNRNSWYIAVNAGIFLLWWFAIHTNEHFSFKLVALFNSLLYLFDIPEQILLSIILV